MKKVQNNRVKTKKVIGKTFFIVIIIFVALAALSSLLYFSDGVVGKAVKSWAVQRGAFQPSAFTQCSDGIDNDDDSLLDYPIDPGCASAVDKSEIDMSIRDNITAFASWNTDIENTATYTPPPELYPYGPYDTGYPAAWDPSEYNSLKNVVLMAPLIRHSPPDNLADPLLPQKIKNWTDLQPAGRRVIQIWTVDEWRLPAHPDDVVLDQNSNVQGFIDKNGKFQPYAGMFWDNAVKEISKDLTNFFTKYKAIGGKVDWVVQDYEGDFQDVGRLRIKAVNYYKLTNKSKGGETKTDSSMGWTSEMDARAAYFAALQQDPRFQAEHQPFLDQYFQAKHPPNSGKNITCDWMDDILILSGECEKRWTAYIKHKVHYYLNEAVYKPIAKIFPAVKNSNFDSMYFDPAYCFPNIAGQTEGNYCLDGEYGSHTGTHQSSYLYARLGYAIEKIKLDGVNNYLHTPFNAFRYDVNKFRLSVLSSDVPNTPWVAFKDFDYHSDSSIYIPLVNTPYYEELILHLLLGGADDLLYYNGPKKDDDIALDNALEEFNLVAGFADRKTLVKNLVGWGDNYVLTGMQSGGRNIYRFTPNDAVSFKVIENKRGVTFISENTKVFIKEGKIYEPKNKVSSVGYWIAQPPLSIQLQI